MTQKQDYTQGFTLIETMLVIVVISVIILYSLNFMRQRETEKSLDTSAKQIEHLLQVAVSYYSRQNEWPNNLPALAPDYITDADLCSPWPGTGYKQCPQRALYKIANFPVGKTNKTASYFGVTVELATETSAQQLAGFLANATVLNKTVTAYITARRYSELEGKGWINSAGVVANGSRVDMPVCGKNFEGHVIFTPLRFTGDDKEVGVFNINTRYLNLFLTTSLFRHNFGTPPNTRATVSTGFEGDQKKSHKGESKNSIISAYFFTFCIPNGSWDMQIPKNDPGPIPTTNDGQCDNNWLKYNPGSKKC